MIFLKTVVMTIVFLSVKNRWLRPAVEKKGVICQMRLIVPDYAGMLVIETTGAAVPPMAIVAAGRSFGRVWKIDIRIIRSYDALNEKESVIMFIFSSPIYGIIKQSSKEA